MLNVFCLIAGLHSIPDTSYGEHLLSTPLHVAVTAPTSPLEWEHMRQSCIAHCEKQGIVINSWSTLFRDAESLAWDCRWAKERLTELKDCPPETDAQYFMCWKPFIKDRLLFNRAFQRYLEKSIEDPWVTQYELTVLLRIKDENERLYVIWGYLGDAFNGSSPYFKRAGLHNLRLYLGDEAYFQGEMPHNVPSWAFRELE